MKPIFYPLRPDLDLEKQFTTYLRKLYTDKTSPVAYSSPTSVYNHIKQDGVYKNIGLIRLTRYMSNFDSYSLNKPRRKVANQKHRRYTVGLPWHQVELDLMSVARFSKQNDGVIYLLVGIDVFSKYGYAIPIQDKKTGTIIKSIDLIITSMAHKPAIIHTDLGTEFTNFTTKQHLKDLKIEQTFARQSTHAVVVERFIRSLRKLLRRFMDENNTFHYLDVLQNLLNIYNTRKHTSTKFAPRDVTNNNAWLVEHNLYGTREDYKNTPYKFSIDDYVRASTQRTIFDKHDYSTTQEIFQIHSRQRRDNVNIYELKSCGDPVVGYFYENELLLIPTGGDKEYQIDKLLDEKKIGNVVYTYVSFKGFPNNKFCNEWVKKSDIIDI